MEQICANCEYYAPNTLALNFGECILYREAKSNNQSCDYWQERSRGYEVKNKIQR